MAVGLNGRAAHLQTTVVLFERAEAQHLLSAPEQHAGNGRGGAHAGRPQHSRHQHHSAGSVTEANGRAARSNHATAKAAASTHQQGGMYQQAGQSARNLRQGETGIMVALDDHVPAGAATDDGEFEEF